MKQPGARAQLFCAEESSYGTPPTILVTHALRHISAAMDFNPYNRVYSPEKKAAPGRYAEFDRRGTASGTLEGLIRPSGTINTLPECSPVLKAAFGSVSNVALSTTVDTTTAVGGCTLASVTGLVAATGGVLIACPDGKKRLRKLTGLNGGAKTITWAPDLPSGQAPADGAAIKSCTVYNLTSANAISLFMARYTFQADYTSGLPEILKGWLIDRLSLMFDYAEEPRVTCSGPAKLKADAPSHPGGFTQIGTNPPTAMAAECHISGNAIKFMKLGFELTNGMEARNDELGATNPTEGYRMGNREISCSIDMIAENALKAYIYDLAMAGTLASLMKQVGFTEGKCVGVYAPRIDFAPPTVDVPDGPVAWPLKGRCLEGTEDANTELALLLG